jgi:hypothetical protein
MPRLVIGSLVRPRARQLLLVIGPNIPKTSVPPLPAGPPCDHPLTIG